RYSASSAWDSHILWLCGAHSDPGRRGAAAIAAHVGPWSNRRIRLTWDDLPMKKSDPLSPKTPLLGAIALVCLTFTGSAGQEAPQTLSNGLTRVPATKVQLAYLRPGTDLTKYKSVHIQTLVVPPTVRDTKPKGERPRIGESYLLRD